MDYLNGFPDKNASVDESKKAIIIKSPEKLKIDSELEKNIYFDELVKDAKKLLENGRLFGFKIDIDNQRDVIAALWIMFLNEQYLNKELSREVGHLMNV